MVYLLTGIGAYESNRFVEAEELLLMGKDYVIKDDKLKSEFEYQLGKSYWKSGDKTKGELFINKAILLSPNNAKAYHGYALLLFDENKLESALLQSNKSIKIAPKSQVFLTTNGQILISLNSYSEAVIGLEKAVMLDYSNSTTLESYGDALFLTGKTDEGLEFWKESQKQGNTSPLLIKKIETKLYHEK
jgi:tetratricopeptide (TPR) repeat protein